MDVKLKFKIEEIVLKKLDSCTKMYPVNAKNTNLVGDIKKSNVLTTLIVDVQCEKQFIQRIMLFNKLIKNRKIKINSFSLDMRFGLLLIKTCLM